MISKHYDTKSDARSNLEAARAGVRVFGFVSPTQVDSDVPDDENDYSLPNLPASGRVLPLRLLTYDTPLSVADVAVPRTGLTAPVYLDMMRSMRRRLEAVVRPIVLSEGVDRAPVAELASKFPSQRFVVSFRSVGRGYSTKVTDSWDPELSQVEALAVR